MRTQSDSASGSPATGTLYSVSNNYIGATSPWRESAITWNNAPSLSSGALAAVGDTRESQDVEVSVDNIVKAAGTYSFALVGDSTNSAFFDSAEEGPTGPTLRLTCSAGATPTPTTTATATPTPTSTATPKPTAGIWISRAEVMALPMSGKAWEALKRDALSSWGTPDIQNQDSNQDVLTFAGAIYAVRTGDKVVEQRVVQSLEDAMGTESGGRTLALGRNLLSYVLAADIIGYRDAAFVNWVSKVRSTTLDGRTLVSTHNDRPNNWGTHAGASRMAADLYVGDMSDFAKAATVFRGYLGDRNAYAGFKYGELWWQADPSKPVGINPQGAMKDGHPIDGVLPDDQRRAGDFTWPPPKENYVWEALQGATVQAEILTRAGYPAWSWSDEALRRAIIWLHDVDAFPAGNDDTWIPWLVNSAYGTRFPAPSPARHGKNIGYADWTHAQ
mgnify:CR=1 FL=1